MSLRKSPTLTPKMRAANRRNARRSTGPTTAGGRWNASQNALQHGHYARSTRRSMLALRENAEEFDRVYRELAEQFQPANAFWNGQVEELAGLYGDLHREQRVQTALRLRGLQELEAKQRVRRAEVESAEYPERGTSGNMLELDRPASFKKCLVYLGEMSNAVRRRDTAFAHLHYVDVLYGGVHGVRGEEIAALFTECMGEPSYDQPPQPPASNAPWGRLEELLDDESRRVNEAWETFKRDYTATNEADCLAAMAPDDPRFMLSLRRENDIRRNIDGKLRLLMNCRPAAATVPAAADETEKGKPTVHEPGGASDATEG